MILHLKNNIYCEIFSTNTLVNINRLGVAKAVLQTPPPFMLFFKIFKTS